MISIPRPVLVAGAILLVLVPTAPAATLAGVDLPDSIKVGDTRLVLNGLGLREATFLKIDVYVAGLYLEEPSRDPEAILASTGPKVVHVHVVRRVGRDDITEAWVEGFENNAPASMEALRDRLARLNGWMEDLAKDESLRFTWTPEAGLEVAVKGTVRGTIEGADFARALFSVFLGPAPPNAGLKEGLLGL